MIESIVAITIISLVAVIAYSGLQTAITSSSQNRTSAEAETLLRTAAERLQRPSLAYSRCAASYAGEMPTVDAGYDGDFQIDIGVRYWTPPMQWGTDCPDAADDRGLQEITLIANKPSGAQPSIQLTILKRRP